MEVEAEVAVGVAASRRAAEVAMTAAPTDSREAAAAVVAAEGAEPGRRHDPRANSKCTDSVRQCT